MLKHNWIALPHFDVSHAFAIDGNELFAKFLR